MILAAVMLYSGMVSQLKGTLLAKGSFQMGGVGDIATVAEEELLVQFNRTDGKKQLITAWHHQSISKSQVQQQSLSVSPEPKIAGGKVDVLLGIQYLHIFPVIVRKSGLTKTVLSWPEDEFYHWMTPWNIPFLAEKAGNTAALLTHFTEGLMRLRQLCPSRILANPMSMDQEMFAKGYTVADHRDICQLANDEKLDKSDGEIWMVDW
jgi:hypothetical protein